MDHTRRDLLAAASMLVATTGCLGDGNGDATASPTEGSATASATATESPTPSETPTEEPTPVPDSTVRIWPTPVTAVFEGDVSHDAILDALGDAPTSAQIYNGERDGVTMTYAVAAGSSLYVPSVKETFADAEGLSTWRVFRGVGPDFRERYESAFGEQVAERAGVDADSVSITPGRLGDDQYLDITAPVDRSALVPMLPELAFERVDGEGDVIVGPEGFVTDTEFAVSYHPNREKTVTFTVTLTEEGISSFADAVDAASDEELRGDFVRPVVGDEAFSPFPVADWLESGLESGDWNGRLRLSFPDRLGTGDVISDLTDLPPVPFQFEPSGG